MLNEAKNNLCLAGALFCAFLHALVYLLLLLKDLLTLLLQFLQKLDALVWLRIKMAVSVCLLAGDYDCYAIGSCIEYAQEDTEEDFEQRLQCIGIRERSKNYTTL